MRRYLLLLIRTRGITQHGLDRLRELLGISPEGRLADDEQGCFGTRHLREGAGETVTLALLRGRDMLSWRLEVAYEGTQPSLAQVDQWRLQILEALTQAGLPASYVRQWDQRPPPAAFW